MLSTSKLGKRTVCPIKRLSCKCLCIKKLKVKSLITYHSTLTTKEINFGTGKKNRGARLRDECAPSNKYDMTNLPFLSLQSQKRSLQHEFQGVLDNLLQLLDPFSTNSTVNDAVVEAAGNSDLVIPLN